jgi:hypothetical protein
MSLDELRNRNYACDIDKMQDDLCYRYEIKRCDFGKGFGLKVSPCVPSRIPVLPDSF